MVTFQIILKTEKIHFIHIGCHPEAPQPKLIDILIKHGQSGENKMYWWSERGEKMMGEVVKELGMRCFMMINHTGR